MNGQVHLNAMENFWSLVKRGLDGTYVSVEPFVCFPRVLSNPVSLLGVKSLGCNLGLGTSSFLF